MTDLISRDTVKFLKNRGNATEVQGELGDALQKMIGKVEKRAAASARLPKSSKNYIANVARELAPVVREGKRSRRYGVQKAGAKLTMSSKRKANNQQIVATAKKMFYSYE